MVINSTVYSIVITVSNCHLFKHPNMFDIKYTFNIKIYARSVYVKGKASFVSVVLKQFGVFVPVYPRGYSLEQPLCQAARLSINHPHSMNP